MEIKNSTKWSTDGLRKLFRRCVKEVDKVEKPSFPFHKRNKHFKLDILNGSHLRGRATIEGYWVMIKIPKLWKLKTGVPTEPDKIDEKGRFCFKAIGSDMSWVCVKDKKDIIKYPYYWKIDGEKEEMDIGNRRALARLIIHEYYHTLGVRNIDRKNYSRDYTKKWNTDWIKDYPIKEKEIIEKPKTDIRLVRYQRAIQNLRRAETRLKRSKTIHHKWKNKVKYYQKVCNFN